MASTSSSILPPTSPSSSVTSPSSSMAASSDDWDEFQGVEGLVLGVLSLCIALGGLYFGYKRYRLLRRAKQADPENPEPELDRKNSQSSEATLCDGETRSDANAPTLLPEQPAAAIVAPQRKAYIISKVSLGPKSCFCQCYSSKGNNSYSSSPVRSQHSRRNSRARPLLVYGAVGPHAKTGKALRASAGISR